MVVWAGLGGTETGNAIADIIYGDKNPSGRLPYTVARSPNDYPAQLTLGENGEEILNITYSEVCVSCFPPFFSPFKLLLSASLPFRNTHRNCAIASQVVRRLSPF